MADEMKASTPLSAGSTAPDFSLPARSGKTISLHDYRGSKDVLIYFYPKDDTPGCTRESCSLRDSWGELQGAGIEVLGISRDDSASHNAFAAKYNLPFELLTDADHAVHEAYGAWGQNPNPAWGVGPLRKSFLVGKEGQIRHVFDKVDTEHHAEQVLRAAGVAVAPKPAPAPAPQPAPKPAAPAAAAPAPAPKPAAPPAPKPPAPPAPKPPAPPAAKPPAPPPAAVPLRSQLLRRPRLLRRRRRRPRRKRPPRRRRPRKRRPRRGKPRRSPLRREKRPGNPLQRGNQRGDRRRSPPRRERRPRRSLAGRRRSRRSGRNAEAAARSGRGNRRVLLSGLEKAHVQSTHETTDEDRSASARADGCARLCRRAPVRDHALGADRRGRGPCRRRHLGRNRSEERPSRGAVFFRAGAIRRAARFRRGSSARARASSRMLPNGPRRRNQSLPPS